MRAAELGVILELSGCSALGDGDRHSLLAGRDWATSDGEAPGPAASRIGQDRGPTDRRSGCHPAPACQAERAPGLA